MIKIGVIGAGSWGTALANLLAEKGYDVRLWTREEEVYDSISKKHINSLFLPGVSLSKRIFPVKLLDEAVCGREVLLMVVPSHFFRGILLKIKEYLLFPLPIICATKGIENTSLMLMSQVVDDVFGFEYKDSFACLSGPSFAQEVVEKNPTAVTLASQNKELAHKFQAMFNTSRFRVYESNDVIGVQLAGALKNVIAIAAGVADGLKLGYNARAAIITRGLAEISRLGIALGAYPLTFAGLAGLGDLILTCTGDLSRNRSVGIKIGQWNQLLDIIASMNMVAEGVKTTKSAYDLGIKLSVEMPMTEQMYHVLYEDKKPVDALNALMNRRLKHELAR